MKTQTAVLRQQVAALVGIGFRRPAAVRMVARSEAARLRKALPGTASSKPLAQVDTSAADKRRERLEAQQRRRPTPAQSSKRPVSPSSKKGQTKPATGKHGKPLSMTRWNIRHENGDVWSYEVKPNGQLVVRPPSQFDVPTYTLEQWRAMQEGINNHIESKKQPAQKEADLKGTTTMRKSQLESLIARARKNPAALSQQTLVSLNQHLAKTGQPTITAPAPVRKWGTMPTIGDIARNVQHATAQTAAVPVPKTGGVFSQAVVTAASQNGRATANLTGYQRAAMSAGLSPDHPGLEKMSFPEMLTAAKQQKLSTANAIRQQQGLPPIS